MGACPAYLPVLRPCYPPVTILSSFCHWLCPCPFQVLFCPSFLISVIFPLGSCTCVASPPPGEACCAPNSAAPSPLPLSLQITLDQLGAQGTAHSRSSGLVGGVIALCCSCAGPAPKKHTVPGVEEGEANTLRVPPPPFPFPDSFPVVCYLPSHPSFPLFLLPPPVPHPHCSC